MTLLILWTILLSGCEVVPYIPAIANFGLTLWDRNTYVTKECLWYEPVKFDEKTKTWIQISNPTHSVLADLKKVVKNNDLYAKACPDGELQE